MWVRHDGVGYLFPQPANLRLSTAAHRGDWAEIGTPVVVY